MAANLQLIGPIFHAYNFPLTKLDYRRERSSTSGFLGAASVPKLPGLDVLNVSLCPTPLNRWLHLSQKLY